MFQTFQGILWNTFFCSTLSYRKNRVRKLFKYTWTWLIIDRRRINNQQKVSLHAKINKKCGIKFVGLRPHLKKIGREQSLNMFLLRIKLVHVCDKFLNVIFLVTKLVNKFYSTFPIYFRIRYNLSIIYFSLLLFSLELDIFKYTHATNFWTRFSQKRSVIWDNFIVYLLLIFHKKLPHTRLYMLFNRILHTYISELVLTYCRFEINFDLVLQN